MREQAEDLHALEQQLERLKATEAQEVINDLETGREGYEEDRSEYQRLLASNSKPWKEYVTSLDEVEKMTGYDFFGNVAESVQQVIESK